MRAGEIPPRIADIGRYFQEARQYAAQYIAVQAARIRIAIRSAVLFCVVILTLAIVGVTVLAVATIFLFTGVAGAIGELLGGRLWAGELIIGIVVLTTITLLGYFSIKRFVRSARRATLSSFEKYTARRP